MRSRGLTLVEVLVSLLVLTVGLAAISRLHAHLRVSAEAARQRAQAVRLAQDEMERLRAFAQVGPGGTQATYADIDSGEPAVAQEAAAPTPYRLERTVATPAIPRVKAVTLTARWTDRVGEPQQVELASMIAGLDPALGGVLTLQHHRSEPVLPLGRHPGIPVTSRPLGDGRSAFQPGGTVVWVFDDVSGVITSVCSGTVRAPSGCRSTMGLLVAGFVRFATQTDTPDPERPGSPAMNLDLCLAATDTPVCNAPALAECFDDAPADPGLAQQTVIYHCAVFPPAGTLHWTGRLNIVPLGWALVATDTPGPGGRICRYSFDHNANGRIDNLEHPALYTQVAGPLTDQNFLVVRGTAACPVDRPVSLGAAAPDNVVNDSTVQHQP